MRAAAIADPARNKACVVVVAMPTAIASVVDRITRLKWSASDTKAASACDGNDQARLQWVKRYRPCRE